MASPALQTSIPDQSSKELQNVNFDASAYFVDTDVTDAFLYSISGLPDGSGFSIDGATGVLSGSPTQFDIDAAPYTVIVTASDQSNNSNTLSIQITNSAGTFPSSGAKRWTPGHYVKTQGNHAQSSYSTYLSGVEGYIDLVPDYSGIKGALVAFSWGRLNTTGTTYDWSGVDQILDYITTNASGQDKLIIELSWKAFTGSVGNAVIGPSDLLSSHRQQTNSGYTMAIYRTAVLDRYLAFLDAFAAQYASESRIELITTAESAPSYGTSFVPGDYTRGDLAAAYNAIATNLAGNFPNTNVSLNLNSLSGEVSGMLEGAYQQGVGLHNPDVSISTAPQLYIGNDAGGETAVRDYSGAIPHSSVASQPVLDPAGKDHIGTPAQIIDAAQTYGITHLAWVTTVSTSGYQWTDVQTAIAADPNLATTCPTKYSSCST